MGFIKKHSEIILYLVFGVLTTLVNFVAFWLFSLFISESLYLLTNFLAWVVAVIFAFVVNKLIVFSERSKDKKTLLFEIATFVGARVFSLIFEEAGLFLLIDLIGMGKENLFVLGLTVTGQIIPKFIVAVVVVIMNYFFSKFLIFKKK